MTEFLDLSEIEDESTLSFNTGLQSSLKSDEPCVQASWKFKAGLDPRCGL